MMLPTEAFADVVSFLGYYDLGGLKLTNVLLCDVANRRADAIRLFDLSGFAFYLYDSFIGVYRIELDGSLSWVCQLYQPKEKNMAAFIPEAFRNCIVGRFELMSRRELVQSAIKVVANTITVAELRAYLGLFDDSIQDFVEFVGSFRRVEVCAMKSHMWYVCAHG